jgi:hypothetical protein
MNRILNFSEFSTKYSKGSSDNSTKTDNLAKASTNFEDGFDETTYDQKPIGPNRPVKSESEPAPKQKSDLGIPKEDKSMEAPKKEKAEDTPEPEIGANPKKVEEGFQVKGFSKFLNEMEDESMDKYEMGGSQEKDLDSDENFYSFDDLRGGSEFGANPRSSKMRGKRVKFFSSKDEQMDIEPGSEGTIIEVDDAGHIIVDWDSGRSLNLIDGLDEYEILD